MVDWRGLETARTFGEAKVNQRCGKVVSFDRRSGVGAQIERGAWPWAKLRPPLLGVR